METQKHKITGVYTQFAYVVLRNIISNSFTQKNNDQRKPVISYELQALRASRMQFLVLILQLLFKFTCRLRDRYFSRSKSRLNQSNNP